MRLSWFLLYLEGLLSRPHQSENAAAAKRQVSIPAFQGYSTNSMGKPLRMSIPLVSTKDDISKNFLLSGGEKKFSSVGLTQTPPRAPRRPHTHCLPRQSS